MKVEVIGTGSAFQSKHGTISFLVWDDAERHAVLFECGYMTFARLRELEEKTGRKIIEKIETVAISHTHPDHCGSLGTLIEYRFLALGKKTKVAGAPLDDYFKVAIPDEFAHGAISGIDRRVKTFPVYHMPILPAFALYYDGVLYSGDTEESVLGSPYAKKAKMIIHEAKSVRLASHIWIDDLAVGAPADIRAKTYVAHFGPQVEGQMSRRAKALGFAGILKLWKIYKV